eukprot:966502_1
MDITSTKYEAPAKGMSPVATEIDETDEMMKLFEECMGSTDILQPNEPTDLSKKYDILQKQMSDMKKSNIRMQERYNILEEKYKKLQIKSETHECKNAQLMDEKKELEIKYNVL